ncbi:hypothetical protein GJ496_012054 [Pomphorhynchus laevis]|nr:hypothetical protein GJ496_012054 [Pomphorhynchus laevis]
MCVNNKLVEPEFARSIERSWNLALKRCGVQLTHIIQRYYGHAHNIISGEIDEDHYRYLLTQKVNKLSWWLKRRVNTDELSRYEWHPNRREFARRPRKINNEKYVVEASPTINLTTEEKKVLQLGLNFAIAPLEYDRFEVAKNLKQSINAISGKTNQPSTSQKRTIEQMWTKYLKNKQVKTPGNVSKEQLRLIMGLKNLLGSVICNSTVDSSTLSSSYLPVYRSNNILHDSLYHQFKGEHGNDKSLSSFKVDNVAITNIDINNNSDSGKRIDDIQFIASSNKHCECDSLSQENSFTSVVDNQINSRNIALSQDSIFVKTSTGCTSSSGINTNATISKCSAQQYIQNLLTVDRGCTITKEYSNNNANKGSKKKQKKKSCSKRQASASIDLNNIATNISYSDVDTTQSINKPIFYKIPIPSSSTTNVSTVSRTTTLYGTGKIGSLHSSMPSPLSYKPVMSNASISANEARTHSPQDSKLNLLLPSSVNTRNWEPRLPTSGEEETDHIGIKQQHLCTEKHEIGGYLSNDISQIYEEVIHWIPNLFNLP